MTARQPAATARGLGKGALATRVVSSIMQGGGGAGTEARPGPGLMVRLVVPLALLWLLFCGIGWLDAGARVSLKWGLLAAAPAFFAAVVVFLWWLVRGKAPRRR